MVVRVQRYPVASWPFESLLDGMFGEVGLGDTQTSQWNPAVSVAEYDSESVVVAELPGVRKEDVKVSVHDGILSISGERKSAEAPEKSSWVRNEIRTGQFARSIRLSHDVNTNAISAELNNGLLKITLPKSEEAKPREIPVQ